MQSRNSSENVGPGAYNNNPFLNIVASVNASHHIVSIDAFNCNSFFYVFQYGYPILGLPKGNKDEAYTVVDGAV